jgi:hypothetical protein
VLSLSAMLASSSLASDRDESEQRWATAPASVRESAKGFVDAPGFATREWPPSVTAAVRVFLDARPPPENPARAEVASVISE